MTTRREESVYDSDSSADTDNVSLNDTEVSERASDGEYDVDYILNEVDTDVESDGGTIRTEKRYLIKWTGYSLFQATWEPESSFVDNGNDALFEWQEERMRRQRGFKKDFDLGKYNEWCDKIIAKRRRRHTRRNKKRAQLGLPQEQYYYDADEDDAYSDSQRSDLSINDDGGDKTGSDSLVQPHQYEDEIAVDDQANDLFLDTNVRKRQTADAPSGFRIPKRKKRVQSSDQAHAEQSTKSNEQSSGDKTYAAPSLISEASTSRGSVPIARMSGGPSRLGRKHAAPAKNVFSMDTQEMQSRDVASIPKEPRQFRNLSHQNNARKKSMQESAPRIETLNLRDAQTGEVLTSSAVRRDSLPTPQSSRPAPSSHLELQARNQPHKIPLTCWYWAHGGCRHQDACGLAHYSTGRMADRNMSQEFITCPYWYGGRCIKEAQDCPFAHKITDYVAAGEWGRPVRKLDSEKARSMRAAQSLNTETLTIRPRGTKGLTCYYWFYGECAKPEEVCPFAHAIREYVAGRRGSGQEATGDHPRLQTVLNSKADPLDQWSPGHQLKVPPITGESSPPTSRADPGEYNSGQSDNITLLSTAPTPKSPAPDKSPHEVMEKFVSAKLKFSAGDGAKNAPFELDAKLWSKESLIFPSPTHGTELDFKHICTADAIEQFLGPSNLEPTQMGFVSSSDNAALEKLAATLKAYAGGAMCFRHRFTLIVFPVGSSVWKYFGSASATSTDMKLQFRLLPRLPMPSDYPFSLGLKDTDRKREAINMDVDGLLNRFDHQAQKNTSLPKKIFLVRSPRNEGQFLDLVAYLHDKGFAVYTPAIKGSWDHFCETYPSGVVLFEQGFELFHKVPKLFGKILTNKFNVFRLRDSVDLTEVDLLFPQGEATYLSDSTFREQPNDTFKALNHLKERIHRRQLTKILGRPGLLDWLLELLSAEPEGEGSYSFRRWRSSYDLLSELLDEWLHAAPRSEISRIRALALSPQSNPPESCPVYFPPAMELPEFEALRRSKSDSRGTDAEDGAKISGRIDELMIQWFSTWALMNVETYRRFVFLTRAPEQMVNTWRQRYPHLDITNADKYTSSRR